jgi:hypothetical protein
MGRSARTVAIAAGMYVALAALAAGSSTATPPTAVATAATIAPSLHPNRLGASAALTFSIRYTGGPYGVPSPVRRSVMQLPAGLTLEIPHLRSCPPARLQSRGPIACPAASQIGHGYALAEVHAGSQLITERVALRAFLGAPRNGEATFEVLAQGYAPLDERIVLPGRVLPDANPYGEELVMSIPPIPSLPLEPDASIVTFSLTIGATARAHQHDTNTVLVPSRCPTGGFPFAANFHYADGSSGSALATVPCTPAAVPSARASRTIFLNETGRLHLTSRHEFTLNEQGSASGTFTGTIYVRLTLVSTTRAIADIRVTRSGGSISGNGTATYRRGREAATFNGTFSVTAGTGSYDRVRGSGLRLSGTIRSSNDAVTVQMSGRMSD